MTRFQPSELWPSEKISDRATVEQNFTAQTTDVAQSLSNAAKQPVKLLSGSCIDHYGPEIRLRCCKTGRVAVSCQVEWAPWEKDAAQGMGEEYAVEPGRWWQTIDTFAPYPLARKDGLLLSDVSKIISHKARNVRGGAMTQRVVT